MRAVLARINGALMFIAVVLALGYLVARPHLGTVYVEEIRDVIAKAPWERYDEFRSEALCRADARQRNNNAPDEARVIKVLFSYRCRIDVRFLWGW